jgi:uncharacterized membrane protein
MLLLLLMQKDNAGGRNSYLSLFIVVRVFIVVVVLFFVDQSVHRVIFGATGRCFVSRWCILALVVVFPASVVVFVLVGGGYDDGRRTIVIVATRMTGIDLAKVGGFQHLFVLFWK